jgi:alpha-glucosidase
LHFVRRKDRETIFCAFNLSDNPAVITLPDGNWTPIGAELNSAHAGVDGKVRLAAWQPCLALRTG